MLSHFFLFIYMYWLMLLPSHCGRSYCQDCGRCYCHNGVVDYITICDIMKVSITLADVIANLYYGRSYCLIFCGGCCYHFFVTNSLFCKVADVIAIVCGRWKPTNIHIWCWHMLLPWWQMELPLVSFYFNFSSEMFSRTSSHMCGQMELASFLFRDGLLTPYDP